MSESYRSRVQTYLVVAPLFGGLLAACSGLEKAPGSGGGAQTNVDGLTSRVDGYAPVDTAGISSRLDRVKQTQQAADKAMGHLPMPFNAPLVGDRGTYV